MFCRALSVWHSQASGKKWESVSGAFASSTYHRQLCEVVVRSAWARISCFIWNGRFLHQEILVSPLPMDWSECERFTSVHACCGLSWLLNLREQNGFVWLGGFWRKVWESHFLPVSWDTKSHVASEVPAVKTMWAASSPRGLAKLRLSWHTLPVCCTAFSGMEQQTDGAVACVS